MARDNPGHLLHLPMAWLSGSPPKGGARPNQSIKCTFRKGTQMHVGTRIEAIGSLAT